MPAIRLLNHKRKRLVRPLAVLNATLGLAFAVFELLIWSLNPTPWERVVGWLYFCPVLACVLLLFEAALVGRYRIWLLGLAVTAAQYLSFLAVWYLEGGSFPPPELLWLLGCAASGPVIGLLAALLVERAFVRYVPDPTECARCSYPLMGLSEPRCPECGHPFGVYAGHAQTTVVDDEGGDLADQ
jgi:hypothetical protein